MRLLKYCVIIPYYLFLILAGFIGGGNNDKDNWDDLVRWARK